ncbi:hypothetical protein [Peribacillus butanolivorans]|uniref:hypothetical protein n=1 Tax=Peribacillus butanolivorans TaxID=421767 RepID=UPI00367AA658
MLCEASKARPVNGQNLTSVTGGDSVELNDSMNMIYNDIELTGIPIGETIDFILSTIT